MANNENLNPPYKPGESGNPAGRKKGSRNRSTIVREMLERAALDSVKESQKGAMGEDFDPATVADQITAAVVAKALLGDVQAFNSLLDSGYGKLKETVENQHSFNKMGSVTAQIAGPEDAQGKRESVELTFDVGKAAPKIEEQ